MLMAPPRGREGNTALLHIEELDALDLLIWHRKGVRAAGLLHCNQSTISRRAQHCLQTLNLRLVRLNGEAFAQPMPKGWLPGVFDHVAMARPLQLLRDRVIDAWIASYQPDLPDPDDPEWAVFDLCRAGTGDGVSLKRGGSGAAARNSRSPTANSTPSLHRRSSG